MLDRVGKINLFKRSMELLFAAPGADGVLKLPDDPVLSLLYGLFDALETDSGGVAAADYVNALVRAVGDSALTEELEIRIFDRLIAFRILPEQIKNPETWSDDVRFLLKNAWNLFYVLGQIDLLSGKCKQAEMLPRGLKMLREFAAFDFSENSGDAPLQHLAKAILKRDKFSHFRSFRYVNGTFLPVSPDSVKPIDSFFGFLGVRTIFHDHFSQFSGSGRNLPLFVNSLPGYGKTSMVLSHALSEPDLTVILADPGELELGWRKLMDQLAARADHKYVLFFDDIDPDKVDWYYFRTNVGGAFSPPENVMVVLAANFDFPTNVLSRGRKVTFPVFDEVRCLEMIEEFLLAFGLKKPSANLISLIGADYTEEYGQKKFTELSPRSLVRYLNIYQQDRIKRKTIVELSFGQLITRPDSQLFHDFNIDLMRSLYGDGYIERMVKEQLRNLE